jgi:hypothetical protein
MKLTSVRAGVMVLAGRGDIVGSLRRVGSTVRAGGRGVGVHVGSTVEGKDGMGVVHDLRRNRSCLLAVMRRWLRAFEKIHDAHDRCRAVGGPREARKLCAKQIVITIRAASPRRPSALAFRPSACLTA